MQLSNVIIGNISVSVLFYYICMSAFAYVYIHLCFFKMLWPFHLHFPLPLLFFKNRTCNDCLTSIFFLLYHHFFNHFPFMGLYFVSNFVCINSSAYIFLTYFLTWKSATELFNPWKYFWRKFSCKETKKGVKCLLFSHNSLLWVWWKGAYVLLSSDMIRQGLPTQNVLLSFLLRCLLLFLFGCCWFPFIHFQGSHLNKIITYWYDR